MRILMRIKKTLTLAAAVMLLCTSCVPGGQPSASPAHTAPAEKDTVEITVVTSYGGDDGNRQNYERAVRQYENSSGFIVRDMSGISNEEWKSGIVASFDEGTEPDVLFYFAGADSNKLVESGKVVSINEIREIYPDYASNMKEDMLPKSPHDGKAYAVPVNGYWEGLFVNKKVLADCGVEMPGANTTWEQFLADCAKISEKGYVPIAASLKEVPHYWFEFCVLNNGNLDSHSETPLSSDDPIGKNWVSGLYDIKDLYERGFFPDDTLTASSAEIDALIINDKAAFMIEGSWKIGWFAENAADISNFTVTYVPGKGERTPTDIIGGLSMGYFITRKAWEDSRKREACVQFVKAMTTDEVVATFGVTSVTALKNGTTPPSEANSLVTDALVMTKNVTGITTATADSLTLASRSNLFGNVSAIVVGDITAEEAVDQCLSIED